MEPREDLVQDLSLEDFIEVGEDEISAEKKIKGPFRILAPDILFDEVDALSEVREEYMDGQGTSDLLKVS